MHFNSRWENYETSLSKYFVFSTNEFRRRYIKETEITPEQMTLN